MNWKEMLVIVIGTSVQSIFTCSKFSDSLEDLGRPGFG